MTTPGETYLCVISGLADIVEIARKRRIDMQLSCEQLDEIAGLAAGHSSKLLRKMPAKALGEKTFPILFGALGLKLVCVEDPAAAAKTLRRRTPRDARYDTSGCRSAALNDASTDQAA